MSNVVQFLEAVSLNPGPLTEASYAAAVKAASFNPTTQKALLDRDAAALSGLLGGYSNVMAYIFPAEPEEDGNKEDESTPDNGDHEGPEHEQESSLAA